jgi:hypothetical protein
METTQGVSLYSYHHLKLAKMLFFLLLYMFFFFNKTEEQEGGTGSVQGVCGGVAQIMCIHVSKCKNDKI